MVMATIETVYLGGLRTQATHVQSGTKIITDAPVDNQGKGEAFSPTDLLSASLASCMLTIMVTYRSLERAIDRDLAPVTGSQGRIPLLNRPSLLAAMPVRIGFRELRSEQKDLGGIIYP